MKKTTFSVQIKIKSKEFVVFQLKKTPGCCDKLVLGGVKIINKFEDSKIYKKILKIFKQTFNF